MRGGGCWPPARRDGRRRCCARAWRCGAGRRSRTSPTSRSRGPRRHGWASSGSRRSRTASRPTSPSAATRRRWPSSRASYASIPCGSACAACSWRYRCGRQADALERYRQGRDALVDELGLEPGRELSALHDAILRQDPALDAPPLQRPRPATRRARSGRWLVASGAALLLAAVTGAILLAGGGRAAPGLLGPDTVGAVDPVSGRLVATVAVPGAPDRLAAWRERVWVVGVAHALGD
jgi:transcriptional activator